MNRHQRRIFAIFPLAVLMGLAACACAPGGIGDAGKGDGLAGDFDPLEMVFVPAGPFFMGCNADVDLFCQADEHPARVIFLDDFWIDKYEASWGVYEKCVEEGYCADLGVAPRPLQPNWGSPDYPLGFIKEPEYPVIKVSWYEALNFCQWQGKTLPTEAQWEKAARGVGGNTYPWGNYWDNRLCNWFDKEGQTHHGGVLDGWIIVAPVNVFISGQSPYGAYNMAGNVWEWTLDWYDPYAYVTSESHNPGGPAEGKHKTLRGGGWHLTFGDDPFPNRCSDRDSAYPPEGKHEAIGFRCVSAQ